MDILNTNPFEVLDKIIAEQQPLIEQAYTFMLEGYHNYIAAKTAAEANKPNKVLDLAASKARIAALSLGVPEEVLDMEPESDAVATLAFRYQETLEGAYRTIGEMKRIRSAWMQVLPQYNISIEQYGALGQAYQHNTGVEAPSIEDLVMQVNAIVAKSAPVIVDTTPKAQVEERDSNLNTEELNSEYSGSNVISMFKSISGKFSKSQSVIASALVKLFEASPRIIPSIYFGTSEELLQTNLALDPQIKGSLERPHVYGTYFPSQNVLVIRNKSAETLLHETVHSVTSKAIYDYYTDRTVFNTLLKVSKSL